MSTAPSGTPPEPPSAQPGQMPGPWALLAATAVGGVIGTRLGPAPLVLAAGAAALALLQQKKSGPVAPQPQTPAESPPVETPHAPFQPGFVAGPTPGTGWHAVPIPTPPPAEHQPSRLDMHDSMQSQVEAWLSRQMQREKEEPVIELGLHAADVAPPPAGDAFFPAGSAVVDPQVSIAPAPAASTATEDDYRPEPFLLDEADCPPEPTEPARSQNHDAFAQLSAPKDMYVVLETAPPQAPSAEEDASPALTQPPPPFTPAPPPLKEPAPPFFTFEAAVPASVPPYTPAVATRPLNLEPLPSLTEPESQMLQARALFFSSPPPIPQVEREPQPAASTPAAPQPESTPDLPAPVFQGAAFPDAIEVPMAFSLDEIPAVLFKEKAPSAEDSPPDSGKPAEMPAFVPTGMPFFKVLEPVREIEVQLAAPGEASFDSPLDAAPKDPWQVQMEAAAAAATVPSAPELDAETGLLTMRSSSHDMMPGSPFWDAAAMGASAQPETPAPAPANALPTGPVVDAEIVIKPRVPETTRPVFVAKPRPLAPSFAAAAQQSQTNGHVHLHLHAHVHAPAQPLGSTQELPAPLETPPVPESPLPSPRPHTRRSSWYSWWQGD